MTPQAPDSIRVLLVDDQRTVLRGLELLVESARPAMVVVGTASNAADACEVCTHVSPDVALVDLDLGASRGSDLIPELTRLGVRAVLVLTGLSDIHAHRDAILAGARGVVNKEASPDVLLKAIAKVHAGELWLDRVSVQKVLSALNARSLVAQSAARLDPRLSALTKRERQIIVAVCSHAGSPAKTIAAMLDITEHTLRNHLTSIYEKLGVATRLELFEFAQRNRIAASAE